MIAAEQTSPIRDAHRELTRARILDAAIDLLRNEDLDALRLADVAAAAGMTERTLYRHFATRDALLEAVWPRLQARVGLAAGQTNAAQDLVDGPGRLFANFDSEQGAVRALAFSRAGRALRRAVNAEEQAAFRRAVQEARPNLKEPDLTRLSAVIQVLCSAFGWAAMRDVWGFTGE